MESLFGAILIITVIVVIIRGFYNIFFEFPSDVKRIADSLEIIAENTKHETNAHCNYNDTKEHKNITPDAGNGEFLI